MSDSEPIVCKPTKWFLWRAAAMVGMFLVLGGWFFKDWRSGYPQKNLEFYSYVAFQQAEEAFRELRMQGLTPEGWSRLAKAQKVEIPESKGVLPDGMEGDLPWPAMVQDYERMRAEVIKQGRGAHPVLWREYTNERGWDETPPKTAFGVGKIRNQAIYGTICLVLAAGGIFILLRTMGRSMSVDGEAFEAPGGPRIPFREIVRIDKRKWDSKGLATVFYRGEGGSERKAKVDGMVYGQFNPEEGAPAQALFDRIMANFSGELVDLLEEEPGSPEE
jgi:hypothetical protein